MKPSIGRIVHYKNTENEKIFHQEGTEFVAAIITRVHSDTTVNLALFRDTWIDFKRSVVQGSGQAQWDWPTRVD